MQRAYSAANQIVEDANAQAQTIVDAAVNDANNIRQSAIQYTDDILRSLQSIITHAMDESQGRFEGFFASLRSTYDIVASNRNELSGGGQGDGVPQDGPQIG